MGQVTAFILGFAAIAATLLPFIKTDQWWIRAFDYPKPQLLFLCVIAFLLWVVLAAKMSVFFFGFAAALAAVTAYNAFLILPFTPLWGKQVAQTAQPDSGHCVRVLISNVLMENDDTDAVRRMIEERAPDIVFLAETDQRWVDALQDVAAEFRHVTAQPQDNYYGLMFMTRLDVDEVEVRRLIKDDIPSIRARLRMKNGRSFTFYGLHPEPPVVGQNSDQRDAELMLVAKELKQIDTPAIIGGDLNDVAWSHTTRQFRRLSGALDPRIGRGLYASFHADYWIARWPLDHLFHTSHFELGDLGLLDSVGSDHFPVFGRLCFVPGDNDNEAPEPERESDDEEAREMIENGRRNN